MDVLPPLLNIRKFQFALALLTIPAPTPLKTQLIEEGSTVEIEVGNLGLSA